MTVWQAIGIFVLIPLGMYVVLAALTLRPRNARGQRYRPGSGWPYEPVWWSAEESAAARPVPPAVAPDTSSTARGGARGSW